MTQSSDMVIAPSRRFAYAANNDYVTPNIFQISINQTTGDLTSIGITNPDLMFLAIPMHPFQFLIPKTS